MIKNPANYAHPFGSVAERMAQALREREQRAAFYEETHEIVSRAFDTHDASTFAAAVARAGAKRRGELTEPPPDPISVAGQILAAGRKRRGEQVDEPDDMPSGELAKQIIAAGRKRRGEV